MGKWDSNISIDTSELKAAEKMLRDIKNGTKKAITRSLNVAVRKAKVEGKKTIKKQYLITKISSVEKSFDVARATYGNMSAAFKSNGRPISLTYFKYRENPSPGVKGTPTAYAQVKKGRGGYTGGFVATMQSGHVGIFVRVKPGDKDYAKMVKRSKKAKKHKTRYPIKQLYSLSATEMLNNETVRNNVQERLIISFDAEFNRQVVQLLNGGN